MSERPHVIIGTTAIAATTIASFASDGAFEANKGSAGTDGDRYYNTTLEKYRFNENGTWKTVFTEEYLPTIGMLQNLGLAASVDSNALTIAVKTAEGEDATSSTPIYVAFRNTTAATGTPVIRSITDELSLTIASGSTLGHTDGDTDFIYVYLIDNAGTVELAASTSAHHDFLSVVTTTAESGNADGRYTLYSETARSSVPCRLVGRLKSSQTTAGTWASAPSEIAIFSPSQRVCQRSEVFVHTANGHGSTNTKIRRFTTAAKETGTAITYADSAADGGSFTINEPGVYSMAYVDDWNTQAWHGITVNSTELTTSVDSAAIASILGLSTTSDANFAEQVCATAELKAGDVVRAHTAGGTTGSTNKASFRIVKISD